MPVFVRLQRPAIGIGCQLLFVGFKKRHFLSAFAINHKIRLPDIEKPVFFAGKFGMKTSHCLAEGNRFADGNVGQRLAAGTVHHRRADVVGSNDRIERRS